MRKAIFIVVSLCIINSAYADSKKADGDDWSHDMQINVLTGAREIVTAQLKDPDSAEFDKMFYHYNKKTGAHLVCGQVNAKNGFGGYTGYEHFISNGLPKNTYMETNFSSYKEFEKSWKMFCVD